MKKSKELSLRKKQNSINLLFITFLVEIFSCNREKELLIAELKKRKCSFERDMWNAETILLGGLGNDPILESSEDPLQIYEKNQLRPKSKTKRIQLFKAGEYNKDNTLIW